MPPPPRFRTVRLSRFSVAAGDSADINLSHPPIDRTEEFDARIRSKNLRTAYVEQPGIQDKGSGFNARGSDRVSQQM
jgi:hypothetical protein